MTCVKPARWPRFFVARLVCFKFLRWLRIANFIRVEIHEGECCAVFHLACPQFVQERPPASILLEIVSDRLDNKMWPASPQSITRWAMLIPAPATFACSFKSVTS